MTAPSQVWAYRTLIRNLAARDLRSRYKKSFLGWLWSLINPATTLAIYSVVFGVFLNGKAPLAGNGHTDAFALYLFTALIGWNTFAGGINTALQSFLASGGLLTRTYFPPECPVVAGALTVITQTLLEAAILVTFMIVVGNLSWTTLLALPILASLTLYAFGIGLVVSLLNVRYRDVAYLTALGLQLLFYATPIVYSESIVDEHPLAGLFLRLNPLTHYVAALRKSLYLLEPPTAMSWLIMVIAPAVTITIGWIFFGRNAPRFIEEI